MNTLNQIIIKNWYLRIDPLKSFQLYPFAYPLIINRLKLNFKKKCKCAYKYLIIHTVIVKNYKNIFLL